MQPLILHITLFLSLVLVIPFNGIFLALLFIIKSGCKSNPNFWLGLFLFIYSIVSLFPLVSSMDHYFLNELMIFPFLFLYIAVMIRPEKPQRISLHLQVILGGFVLLLMADSEINLITNLATIIYLLINGAYFTGSLYLMIGIIQENGLRQISRWYDDYREPIVIFLLVTGTVIFNSLMYSFFPDHSLILIVLSKAVLILYIFHRVFMRADSTA